MASLVAEEVLIVAVADPVSVVRVLAAPAFVVPASAAPASAVPASAVPASAAPASVGRLAFVALVVNALVHVGDEVPHYHHH